MEKTKLEQFNELDLSNLTPKQILGFADVLQTTNDEKEFKELCLSLIERINIGVESDSVKERNLILKKVGEVDFNKRIKSNKTIRTIIYFHPISVNNRLRKLLASDYPQLFSSILSIDDLSKIDFEKVSDAELDGLADKLSKIKTDEEFGGLILWLLDEVYHYTKSNDVTKNLNIEKLIGNKKILKRCDTVFEIFLKIIPNLEK